MLAHNKYRDEVIEECAANLAAWYPDNVSTNAFCAALRSMKGPEAATRAVKTFIDNQTGFSSAEEVIVP